MRVFLRLKTMKGNLRLFFDAMPGYVVIEF